MLSPSSTSTEIAAIFVRFVRLRCPSQTPEIASYFREFPDPPFLAFLTLLFSFFPKGSKRCFPNGVFQIPHLSLQQRKKTLQKDNRCLKHQCFKAFWCLLPLRILTTLSAHHSEKHRLENTVCYYFSFFDFPAESRSFVLQNRSSKSQILAIFHRTLRSQCKPSSPFPCFFGFPCFFAFAIFLEFWAGKRPNFPWKIVSDCDGAILVR